MDLGQLRLCFAQFCTIAVFARLFGVESHSIAVSVGKKNECA